MKGRPREAGLVAGPLGKIAGPLGVEPVPVDDPRAAKRLGIVMDDGGIGDAEAEAAETEVWLELAVRCGYLDEARRSELEQHYEHIMGKLVTMLSNPDQWVIHTMHEEEPDYV